MFDYPLPGQDPIEISIIDAVVQMLTFEELKDWSYEKPRLYENNAIYLRMLQLSSTVNQCLKTCECAGNLYWRIAEEAFDKAARMATEEQDLRKISNFDKGPFRDKSMKIARDKLKNLTGI